MNDEEIPEASSSSMSGRSRRNSGPTGETRRRPVRHAHLTRLAQLMREGVVIVAGALGNVESAFIVVRVADEAAARDLAETDVYWTSGAWATFLIRPYGLAVGKRTPLVRQSPHAEKRAARRPRCAPVRDRASAGALGSRGESDDRRDRECHRDRAKGNQLPATRDDPTPDPIGRPDKPAEQHEAEEIPGCLAVHQAAIRNDREKPEREHQVRQAVRRVVDARFPLVSGDQAIHQVSPSSQKSPSMGAPSTRARRKARRVDGQYWPVSIELIVCRLTPAVRAS